MEQIGEKMFIKQLLPELVTHNSFVNGFGHDASILDIGLEKNIVLKIDRAASPIASIKGWCDYRLWGKLAVTSNCSDILACGGFPTGVMMAVCVPKSFEVKVALEIINGANEECEINNIAYLGGDTKETKDPNIVGCAVGWINKDFFLNRNTINAGDYIVIAGYLGGYMGSYILMMSNEGNNNNEHLIQYMANPKAQWNEAKFMIDNRIPKAGMDTSDGLFDALLSMSGGNFGATLFLDELPFHENAVECVKNMDINLYNLAFTVGDWNIVYTVSPEKLEQLNRINLYPPNLKLKVIGQWTDEHKSIIGLKSNGNKYLLSGIVNEHFRKRMEDQGDYMAVAKTNISLTSI
ncbi:AIR synthase related protein [Spirosoma litoris]